MKYVKLRTLNNRTEAEVVKSFLAARGIEAHIHADDAGGIYPALAQSFGAAVMVPEDQAAAALEALQSIESGDEE